MAGILPTPADPTDYVMLLDAIVKDRTRSDFAEPFDAFAIKLKAYNGKASVDGAIA
ncbi:MAG: hypothetical protein ACR2QF_01865 [Geminicoccaceae bacterium]